MDEGLLQFNKNHAKICIIRTLQKEETQTTNVGEPSRGSRSVSQHPTFRFATQQVQSCPCRECNLIRCVLSFYATWTLHLEVNSWFDEASLPFSPHSASFFSFSGSTWARSSNHPKSHGGICQGWKPVQPFQTDNDADDASKARKPRVLGLRASMHLK